MTNGEKFKTAKTKERAFEKFCHKHRYCINCPAYILARKNKLLRWSFAWLDLKV